MADKGPKQRLSACDEEAFKVYVWVRPMNSREKASNYSKKNLSIVKTKEDKVSLDITA